MNTVAARSKQEYLEQLQALGFEDEADYAEYQRILAKAKEMQKQHTLLCR